MNTNRTFPRTIRTLISREQVAALYDEIDTTSLDFGLTMTPEAEVLFGLWCVVNETDADDRLTAAEDLLDAAMRLRDRLMEQSNA